MSGAQSDMPVPVLLVVGLLAVASSLQLFHLHATGDGFSRAT